MHAFQIPLDEWRQGRKYGSGDNEANGNGLEILEERRSQSELVWRNGKKCNRVLHAENGAHFVQPYINVIDVETKQF